VQVVDDLTFLSDQNGGLIILRFGVVQPFFRLNLPFVLRLGASAP
jgi:hypothetical protein